MKKLFLMLAVLCCLTLGCQPATPPADTGAGTDTSAAGADTTEQDDAEGVVEEDVEVDEETVE